MFRTVLPDGWPRTGSITRSEPQRPKPGTVVNEGMTDTSNGHRTRVCRNGLVLLLAGYRQSPAAKLDGLVRVKSKRLDVVYLQPGADFRSYTKVMLDPTEVAFAKNWS